MNGRTDDIKYNQSAFSTAYTGGDTGKMSHFVFVELKQFFIHFSLQHS